MKQMMRCIFLWFGAKMAATHLHSGRVGHSLLHAGGHGLGEDACTGVSLHRELLGGHSGRGQHSGASQLDLR